MKYIRYESHRHRDKIKRHLGRVPTTFFSFYEIGNWFEVSPDEIASLRNAGIRAVVKRDTAKLLQCINWN